LNFSFGPAIFPRISDSHVNIDDDLHESYFGQCSDDVIFDKIMKVFWQNISLTV
jgi:hypothetical protein